MAKMEIPVVFRGRACLVDGETPAMFLMFAETDEPMLQFRVNMRHRDIEEETRRFRELGACDAKAEIVLVKKVGAIVEYPDGKIDVIYPVERIRILEE